MKGALLVLALAGLILHSNSMEILCTSIQTRNGTRYFVPETTASGCLHSWANSSNHVLAGNTGKLDQLVASSNISTLLTYSCYSWMKYTRSCISEGKEITGICIINCTTFDHQKASGPAVTPMVLLIVSSVLLSAAIVGILCFIFKKQLCRGRRPSYTTGNQSDEVQIQLTGEERRVPV